MQARGARAHIDVAACHEAGHALAALWQGLAVVRVDVSLGHPGAGRTWYRLPPRRNPFDPSRGPGCARAAWEDTVSRTLREARVALAGPLAEARLLGKPMRALGARGDMEHCRRLVFRLASCREWLGQFCELPPMDPEAVMNRERTRVRRWLARPTTECLVHHVARTLTSWPVLFACDLDVIVGYLRWPQGFVGLPFPSFDRGPEVRAWQKAQQKSRAAASAPSGL